MYRTCQCIGHKLTTCNSKTTWPSFIKFLYACFLWPWLDPPRRRCDTLCTSVLRMTSCFHMMGTMDQNISSTTLCLEEFARWRHQDNYGVWLSSSECGAGAKSAIYDCLVLSVLAVDSREVGNMDQPNYDKSSPPSYAEYMYNPPTGSNPDASPNSYVGTTSGTPYPAHQYPQQCPPQYPSPTGPPPPPGQPYGPPHVVVVGSSPYQQPMYGHQVHSYIGHIVFACVVLWCCNWIFGLIAFILASQYITLTAAS